MPDTPDATYSVGMRAVALAGLFALGLLAYVLIDIASGGRLTERDGCKDCGDKGDTTDG